jgi:hypothetical protein
MAGDRPGNGVGGADGVDVTWLLTHGADMAWRYARSVQQTLVDVTAALDTGDWPLCVEACARALGAIAVCHRVGAGLGDTASKLDYHLWLATDECAAAVALRELPWPVTADAVQAHAAAATVLEHDAELRSALPFVLPAIRENGQYAGAVRIAATIARLRRERGLGPLDWSHEGL